jgi:cytochrome b subunit of formate dehydrogenase
MKQGYIALQGSLYTFAIIVILVLTISGLIVWPAVWSNNPSRRRAAYAVLDRILKLFRPTRP